MWPVPSKYHYLGRWKNKETFASVWGGHTKAYPQYWQVQRPTKMAPRQEGHIHHQVRVSPNTTEQRKPRGRGLQLERCNLAIAPKIKTFLWKASNKALSVGEALERRGIQGASLCKACGAVEIEIHIFCVYLEARRVWDRALILDKTTWRDINSIKDLLLGIKSTTLLPPLGLRTASLFPWLLWFI